MKIFQNFSLLLPDYSKPPNLPSSSKILKKKSNFLEREFLLNLLIEIS